MKKLILALLFLLLSCSISFAENQQLALIGPVIAGGCATESCNTSAAPNDMETAVSSYEVFKSTSLDWYSSAFISDGSTICAMEFYFDTSTGTDPSFGSIAVYVYSDDGTTNCNGSGCPSSQLATFSSLTTVGLGAAGWKGKSTGTFVGDNATRYHVVLHSSGVDGTNIPRWYRDNVCTTENISYSADGSSWTGSSSSNCQNIKLYKAP